MNKEQLLKYCGSLEQAVSVRPVTYADGRANGLRAVQVKNGPLEYTLMADKCLDPAELRYKGLNMSFLSKPGLQGRNPYDTHGGEAIRSIMGGAMFTCGFENIHGPRTVDGEEYPMHGRMRTTPVEKLSMDARFEGEDYAAVVSGEAREAALFGQNMVLRRTVTSSYGESAICFRDEIENQAFRPEALCFLYHINAGYPFLEAGCRFLIPHTKCEHRTEESAAMLGKHLVTTEPIDNAPEQVYLYTPAAHSDGSTFAALVNDRLGLALCVRWNVKQIPYLTQWRSMASGDYAVALEPTNADFDSRESANTEILQPLQTHVNEFSICVVEGSEAIAALEAEYTALMG